MKVLLSTAYWPNLHFFYYLINAETVQIEHYENYQKQSFRNRTQILTANGILDLSIPVIKKAPKELSKDIQISYAENWQQKHWRAIVSAYSNSPYFEYFETEISKFYLKKYDLLPDYELQQIQCILKILKLKKEISSSDSYQKSIIDFIDLREIIHPKISFQNDPEVANKLQISYYQTFADKFNFLPNLSILDLIFNTGLESLRYLKK